MIDENAPISERLKAAQAEAARLRAESFVDYCPTVAGERIGPVTLETYNALIAFGNAFVTGDAIRFDDIANFIWLHHPHFSQFARKEKAAVTRRIHAHLRPTFPTLNGALDVISQLPRFRGLRRLVVPGESERVGDAIAEIRRIIHEATCDIPTSDSGGEPLPYAFQAYVLNLFRRELGMSFEETSALPLRRVAQHLRELVHHVSRGKALLLTPKEAEIWREHLAPKPATPAAIV